MRREREIELPTADSDINQPLRMWQVDNMHIKVMCPHCGSCPTLPIFKDMPMTPCGMCLHMIRCDYPLVSKEETPIEFQNLDLAWPTGAIAHNPRFDISLTMDRVSLNSIQDQINQNIANTARYYLSRLQWDSTVDWASHES